MKQLFSIALLLTVLWATSVPVLAQEDNPNSAYKNYKTITPVAIAVPTVVAVPIENINGGSNSFLVQELESGAYIGSHLLTTYVKKKVSYTAIADISPRPIPELTDGNRDSAIQFNASSDGLNTVSITLSSDTPQAIDRLIVQLAPHVSLPRSVAIDAQIGGTWQTVVARTPMRGSVVTFPKTTTSVWRVTFTYAQPLRIAELQLQGPETNTQTVQELRFLAKPEASYVIYIDADRYVSVNKNEAGDLANNIDVLKLAPVPTLPNPTYIPADVDGDGIEDMFDNCVQVANEDQIDANQNGRGDACDDFDKDGKINSQDNCPNDPNQLQKDEDGDGIGDACDAEESRFTEKNPWIPWVGMGGAAAVLIILFTLVVVQTKKEDQEDVQEKEADDTPEENLTTEGDTETRS